MNNRIIILLFFVIQSGTLSAQNIKLNELFHFYKSAIDNTINDSTIVMSMNFDAILINSWLFDDIYFKGIPNDSVVNIIQHKNKGSYKLMDRENFRCIQLKLMEQDSNLYALPAKISSPQLFDTYDKLLLYQYTFSRLAFIDKNTVVLYAYLKWGFGRGNAFILHFIYGKRKGKWEITNRFVSRD